MTKEQRESMISSLRNAVSIVDAMANDLSFDVSEDEVPKGKPYHYIVAWGLVMMSMGYYVSGQIVKAREDDAPEDAIYYSTEYGWVTFNSVDNVIERRKVESYISILTREGA